MKNTIPIVFIHGHSGSRNSFQFIAPHFKDTVTFDLPGFGDHEKPKVVYDKNFFLKFLETKITKPSIVVGYSMGAVLAKEFALAHPALVKKLVLIGYPMHKDHETLMDAYRHNWFYRQYVDASLKSWVLCHLHELYRIPVLFVTYLTNKKHYLSRRDWFKHTYRSAMSSLHNTLLTDDWRTLRPLTSKTFLIVGERDRLVDKELIKEFRYAVVPHMAHWIFDYDEQIAALIKKELESVQ